MVIDHKSIIWTNDMIIYRHFQKSRRNPPWRVTTSQRFVRMIASPIHIFKSQREIPFSESPQVNDLDK